MFGDLEKLNSLGATGWHVVTMHRQGYTLVALMERELPQRAERPMEFPIERSRFETT